MTNQGSTDQTSTTQQGVASKQGTAENKVKNKLPKIQPYEDISVSAALLGQVVQQLDGDSLAFDIKPIESLLAVLAQFNVNELLKTNVGQLQTYLSDLNSLLLQQTNSTLPELAAPVDGESEQKNQSAVQTSAVSSGFESSLLNVEDSALRQVDSQSIMRESISSVQQSTLSLSKAIDIQSLDENFTELNWSIGAVNNSVQALQGVLKDTLDGNTEIVAPPSSVQTDSKTSNTNLVSPQGSGLLHNTATDAKELGSKTVTINNHSVQTFTDKSNATESNITATKRVNTGSKTKAANKKARPAVHNAKQAIKANIKNLSAFKQLDMQGAASQDINLLLDAAPTLLKALNLNGPAKALQSAMPALKQLDLHSMAAGDMTSLLDAGPSLLKAANLTGPAKALQSAMPALKQLDLHSMAAGDMTSLLDAGPSLLKAANLKGPAKALKSALPALQQLDLKAVLDGDLQSLVNAGPGLLNAFGFSDAASMFKKHSSTIGKLDFKGILNGDLSSIGDAAVDFLSDVGADEATQKEKPKRAKRRATRKRKGRRGAATGRQRQYRSNNQPWVKENRDVTVPKKSSKTKVKTAKPALKVLDGGLSDKSQGNKSNSSQHKRRLGKGGAANDPIFSTMKKTSGKFGGVFKSLAKSPVTKMLGRFTGPLRTIFSAADVANTLADDSLTKREKSQQIGSAAGGVGGALAGAAAGAAIGSIIPGVGTLIGGAIGGAIGSFGGESIGGVLGDWFGNSLEDKPATKSAEKVPTISTEPSLAQNQPHNALQLHALTMNQIDKTLGKKAANEPNIHANVTHIPQVSEGATQERFITNQHSVQAPSQALANNTTRSLSNILSFAGNVLGPTNAIVSTLLAAQPKDQKPSSALSKVANDTGRLGHTVNGVSILNTATNNALSGKDKAQKIGEIGGGWLAGEAITRTLAKSKNPKLAATAPLLSFFGGNAAGKALGSVSGWFAENVLATSAKPTTKSAAKSQALDNSVSELNEIGIPEAKMPTAQPNVNNSSVTVNANITVNATPDMSAMDIAEQIKQVLEQKQQQAQRDMRLRYIDEVA